MKTYGMVVQNIKQVLQNILLFNFWERFAVTKQTFEPLHSLVAESVNDIIALDVPQIHVSANTFSLPQVISEKAPQI